MKFMTTIVNPKRKKQIEEFLDKDHASMSKFYDVLESSASAVTIKRSMKKLIAADPDYYDPYIVLADLEKDEGKANALIDETFNRAIQRITDAKGNWPRFMPWGWLENRHLMRMIERRAMDLWNEGKVDDALDIFRRLLRANPGDNQGARYSIVAIRLGLGTDWDAQFEVKDGPLAGEALDAMAVDKWYEKNAKKFPEEFDWLKGAMKELGYEE